MARQWGERQPDGSVNVYQQNDDGTIVLVRNEPWNVNQGIPAATTASNPAQPTATPTPQATAPAIGGNYGGIGGLIDAAAYGNTQHFELSKRQIEAQIDLANRNYQLAVNADQRAQALLDLQRWQAELNRVQHAQDQYTELAKTLLQAAVEKSSRPNDYFQYAKLINGGRDIFAQVSGGAPPAFQAPAGAFQPGDITDILARLGVPAYPTFNTPIPGGAGSGGAGGGSNVPAPGVQPTGGVTQAQADAVANGLGIDPKFLYEYVREKGSLPSLQSLNDWMNAKGYRDPNTGRLTGRVPNVGWQGSASSAGDQGPGTRNYSVAGTTAGGAGGTTAVAAPPATSDAADRYGPMYAGYEVDPSYSSQSGVVALRNPRTGAVTFVRDPSLQDVNNAGEAREGQNSSDAQSNMDLADQNQRDTGYYGYGSLG